MSDDGVELARLEKRVDGKEDVLEDLIVDVSVFRSVDGLGLGLGCLCN